MLHIILMCISHFMFLANDIICCLLLFSHSVLSDSLQPLGLQHTRLPSPSLSLSYFIFILEYRNDGRQKENSRNFLIQVHNSLQSNVQHQQCIWSGNFSNGCTVQRLFKKFCKGDESLENEESSGCLWKLTMTNWEQLSKPILLQLHKKLPKNSMSTNL